jgi:hypothetical protein
MRYPASEKLEIIRLVEQSHLPAGRKLGILRSTFYRWYDRYANVVLEPLLAPPGAVDLGCAPWDFEYLHRYAVPVPRRRPKTPRSRNRRWLIANYLSDEFRIKREPQSFLKATKGYVSAICHLQ